MDQIINTDDPELEKAKYYAYRLYNRDLPKMISEEIIYITPEHKTVHLPGITINNDQNQIVWVGRILSNDFSREFSEHDIHINTTEGIIPFREYWNKKYSRRPIETYYIKRVYSL